MSISFTGAGGGFTRLGKVAGLVRNVNGLIGAVPPSPASAWGAGGPAINDLDDAIDAIEAQFATSNQSLTDTLYQQRESYRSAHVSLKQYLRTLATNIVVEMANDDVRLPSKNLPAALAEWIRQMKTPPTQRVDNPIVSATVGALVSPSTSGADGQLVASVKGPDGVDRAYLFAETLDVTCTNDSQSQSGLKGAEPFTALGDAAVGDGLAWNFPQGSGSSKGLTALAAGSSGNLLTNGDFEDFTVANTPDAWTLDGSSAGTDVFSEATTFYAGSKALRFTGMASGKGIYLVLTSLKPSTVYQGCVWLRKSAGLAAGVLSIDLHNGTAIIQDAAAVDNAQAVTLSGLTLPFAATTFTFRTPAVMPGTVRFRLHITTSMTAAEHLYIDHLSLKAGTELYAGGPYATIFSGATPFLTNDRFPLTIANDLSGTWQLVFEQLFGMRALGLQLPSTGTTLIDDSLIG
jgi:hypothetical protein